MVTNKIIFQIILSVAIAIIGLYTLKGIDSYSYVREFFPAGFDNLAVCKDRKYLLGIDQTLNNVTVLDIKTGATVFVIGNNSTSLSDGGHFNKPFGVVCDEKHGHIIVADTGNKKIQVFSIDDFSFVKSYEVSERYATIALDAKRDHVFAIVLPDGALAPPGIQIRVLDAVSFQPIGEPLTLSWPDGQVDEHEKIMYANDLAIDEKINRLLVVDYGNARFDEFDLDTLTGGGVVGVASRFYDYGYRALHPNRPTGIAVDDAGNVFIADDRSTHRIQIFREDSLESLKGDHIFVPEKLITFGESLFVVDSDPKTGRRFINLFEPNKNNKSGFFAPTHTEQRN